MSNAKGVPNSVRVDQIVEKNEFSTSSSIPRKRPFGAQSVRYPYDVMLSGLNRDGSTFKLTFNAYELRTERAEDQDTEGITRYYSNNCVLVQTRRKG
jgi:hypothetical protein